MTQSLKNQYHKLQSKWANIRYGHPASSMDVIGVTGTDGKTTSVSMIYHILKKAGLNVAMISTIEIRIGERSLDAGLHVTTPEPWEVPKYLKMMKREGVEYVVVEATSNGLDQNRLADIKFDSAMITNIREDHLDYHKTWENYARAKFRLIENVKENGLVVLNDDDERSASWLLNKSQTLKRTVYAKWFSKKDFFNKRMTIDGLEFDYEGQHFKIPQIGKHNFENIGQVINICKRYLKVDRIKDALLDFQSPLGRMQLMQSRPFTVIVDFAHTPNALEKALESVNQIKSEEGSRIIAVFGCAGQRDKGRRRMGQVSAKFADITVLTAEDPRDEDLEKVNREIFSTAIDVHAIVVDKFATRKLYNSAPIDKIKEKIDIVLKNNDKPFFMFNENTSRSREDAIDFALKIARKGDIVFITGKGHEKSMAFGDPVQEFPWSDQDIVKERLKEMAREA